MHCVIWLLILPVKPCNRPVPSCSNALNIWRRAGLVPLDLATEEKRTTRTIVVMKKWRKSMRRVLFLKNIATATAAEAAATVVCLWFLSPWNTTLHAHTHNSRVDRLSSATDAETDTDEEDVAHSHTQASTGNTSMAGQEARAALLLMRLNNTAFPKSSV